MDKQVIEITPIDIAKAIGMSHYEFSKLEAREKWKHFHEVHYGCISNGFVGKMFS